ncbi:unnamed protein product, partial [Ectocarpus sp. 12 AP-2014]
MRASSPYYTQMTCPCNINRTHRQRHYHDHTHNPVYRGETREPYSSHGCLLPLQLLLLLVTSKHLSEPDSPLFFPENLRTRVLSNHFVQGTPFRQSAPHPLPAKRSTHNWRNRRGARVR